MRSITGRSQSQNVLENLARFSSEVGYQLGIFKFQGEKTDKFDAVCDQAYNLFEGLDEIDSRKFLGEDAKGVEYFLESSEALKMIYAASEDEQMWNQFSEKITRVKQSGNPDEVENDIEDLRDWFGCVSAMVRSSLRHEKLWNSIEDNQTGGNNE